MFSLIPFTRIELKTYLKTEDARHRLDAEVDPRSIFTRGSWRRDHRFFIGEVREDGRFQINRITRLRNSFLPYIYGEITDNLDMTRVKMRLHPHPLVMILMPIFLGVFFCVFLGALFMSGDLVQNWGTVLLSLAFLLLLYAVVVVFFNFEVKKARQKLEEIFQVE